MHTPQTPGRRPTLREVLDYYTRQDFLAYLLVMLGRYPIVSVIPQQLHWEPNWQRDAVVAESIEDLRGFIVQKITQGLSNTELEERPPFYPSFHQSVCKRKQDQDGRETSERNRLKDCVFEADLPTWQESFMDIEPILSVMERFNVRYRHKFSGHRSLHLIIPGEILPEGYRMQGAHKFASLLLRWSGSQAHPLPHITRMPYSLNEDTGLACLPIPRGELASFRPWQANLHLVEVQSDLWQEIFFPEDKENIVAFLHAIKTGAFDPPAGKYIRPDQARIRSASLAAGLSFRAVSATQSPSLPADPGGREAGETARAFRLLAGSRPISEECLIENLESAEADARWLAVEAYLLHGTGLTQAGMIKLLGQAEEYVRAAAVDVLLRFEDKIIPILVGILGDLRHYSSLSAKTAYLLGLSDSLRSKVLEAVYASEKGPHDALILAACLTGAVTGNWKNAGKMLLSIRGAGNISPQDRTRLEALDIMPSLGGWDKQQGAQQAHRMAKFGPEITELLLFAVGSPNKLFRRDIITALAELADPRATDLLVLALGDDYSHIRRKAIQGLIKIGEPALDALLAAAGSDQAKVRRYALVCLRYIDAAQAKPAVLAALGDSDEAVQRQAVRALGTLLDAGDLERLKPALRQIAWENAKELAVRMAGLGEEGIRALETMMLEEHNPAAAFAIARRGDERGRQILLSMLASEDEALQNVAVELLRELKDERCIAYLAGQMQTLTHWRAAFLALELGKIGTPQAVDALIQALGNEFRLTRRGAVRGLAEAKDPRAIEPLIRCLNDNDRKVRSLAGEALIKLGPSAIAPLQRALDEASDPAGTDGRAEMFGLGKQNRNLIRYILEKLGTVGAA